MCADGSSQIHCALHQCISRLCGGWGEGKRIGISIIPLRLLVAADQHKVVEVVSGSGRFAGRFVNAEPLERVRDVRECVHGSRRAFRAVDENSSELSAVTHEWTPAEIADAHVHLAATREIVVRESRLREAIV